MNNENNQHYANRNLNITQNIRTQEEEKSSNILGKRQHYQIEGGTPSRIDIENNIVGDNTISRELQEYGITDKQYEQLQQDGWEYKGGNHWEFSGEKLTYTTTKDKVHNTIPDLFKEIVDRKPHLSLSITAPNLQEINLYQCRFISEIHTEAPVKNARVHSCTRMKVLNINNVRVDVTIHTCSALTDITAYNPASMEVTKCAMKPRLNTQNISNPAYRIDNEIKEWNTKKRDMVINRNSMQNVNSLSQESHISQNDAPLSFNINQKYSNNELFQRKRNFGTGSGNEATVNSVMQFAALPTESEQRQNPSSDLAISHTQASKAITLYSKYGMVTDPMHIIYAGRIATNPNAVYIPTLPEGYTPTLVLTEDEYHSKKEYLDSLIQQNKISVMSYKGDGMIPARRMHSLEFIKNIASNTKIRDFHLIDDNLTELVSTTGKTADILKGDGNQNSMITLRGYNPTNLHNKGKSNKIGSKYTMIHLNEDGIQNLDTLINAMSVFPKNFVMEDYFLNHCAKELGWDVKSLPMHDISWRKSIIAKNTALNNSSTKVVENMFIGEMGKGKLLEIFRNIDNNQDFKTESKLQIKEFYKGFFNIIQKNYHTKEVKQRSLQNPQQMLASQEEEKYYFGQEADMDKVITQYDNLLDTIKHSRIRTQLYNSMHQFRDNNTDILKVSAPTGCGKNLCMSQLLLDTVKNYNEKMNKILVVCPRLNLLEELKDGVAHANIPRFDSATGSYDINNFTANTQPAALMCHATFTNLLKSGNVQQLKGYTVFIDESHLMNKKYIETLLQNGIKVALVSATHKKEHNDMVSQMVQQNSIIKDQCIITEHDALKERVIKPYLTYLDRIDIENKSHQERTVEIMDQLHNSFNKGVVYVNSVEEAGTVSNALHDSNALKKQEDKFTIFNITGDDKEKKTQQFSQNKKGKSVAIACNRLKEGSNANPNFIIDLKHNQSDPDKTKQKAGRLRDGGIYIAINDKVAIGSSILPNEFDHAVKNMIEQNPFLDSESFQKPRMQNPQPQTQQQSSFTQATLHSQPIQRQQNVEIAPIDSNTRIVLDFRCR